MSSTGVSELLAEEPWLSNALTVTATRTADEDEVIRCFGGDPALARNGTWLDFPESKRCIAVARLGATVVVAEPNDYQGSREAVLRPLSQLGRTASVFWNVNGSNRLSLAEDGLVVSSFDMSYPEDGDLGPWGECLEGLAFGTGVRWEASGLTAVERATGARLALSWARGPHRLAEIVPVTHILPPQDIARSPLLQQEPLASLVPRLGPDLLPELRRHALGLAVAHTLLADHPLVQAAMTADDAPAATREQLRDDLKNAYHNGVYEARHLSITDPTDGRPEWELPSRRRSAQAIVMNALADHLELELGNPTGFDADPMASLQVAMDGDRDSEPIQRFWILWKLHDASSRRAC